ncbi:V-type ATPase subunit [Lacrimispora sp. NSJ-141]|uniref:V-type ATPase subunit n=1 Tax=Lientehia hominis TaxID=2897778 RepID=A0AAP2W8C1_9FIRM|nr:V-type ATPase subunit [Lientehia hominis]MCD2493333.1 V-type ATPase subunit [Lientehia hominis]
MGNLFAYSGITTKIRAMQSRLLKKEDYQNLCSLRSVYEADAYLRRCPTYEKLFISVGTEDLHRTELEGLLHYSLYEDYGKLYGFSNLRQRKFLDLYFLNYEISVLKTCLRSVFSDTHLFYDVSLFKPFFDKHSKFDIEAAAHANSMADFLSCLKDSEYYKVFSEVERTGSAALFDYENHLDLYYFRKSWSNLKKYLKSDEQKEVLLSFGSRLDMLNIQWIYRSKKYYSLSSAEVYGLLIPITYKLKTEQLKALVDAESLDLFFSALRETRYKTMEEYWTRDNISLEDSFRLILDKIYKRQSQKDPYSIATLNAYLYNKEQEVENITTAIEGIRYHLDPDIILQQINQL